MKKITLLTLILIMALSVSAQNVTFNFTTNGWGLPTSKVITRTAYTNADSYTIYLEGSTGNGFSFNGTYLILGKKGASLEFPAFDFDVDSIVVVGNSGASAAVEQNIFVGNNAVSTATTGALVSNKYVIDAAHKAAGTIYTLKITSAHNTQITSIKIYEAVEATTVATPVITPSTSTVTEPTQVSIATSTAGAAIYYTTDGTTPTTSSTAYTTPFTVSTTTTINAFATAAGLTDSDVATATITVEAGATVADIAGFLAGTQGTEYTITGAVTVAYQDDAKRNMYVKDNSGWLLVFASPALTTAYTNGEMITGLKGTLGIYGGSLQMTTPIVPATTAGTALVPAVTTVAALTVTDNAKFIKLENVQYSADVDYSTTATVNGILTDNALVVRDNFRNGGSYTAGTAYSITGFVSIYNGAIQVFPIEIVAYIPTANDTHTANALAIYTNNEELMISVANGTVADIYSTTGAKVLSATVENGAINISNLNKGVYMVRVADKTEKFVK